MRLDGNLRGQAAVVVQAALLENEKGDLKLMRRSAYQEPVTDQTYKGLVLARSQAIDQLSRDTAAAIKKTLSNSSQPLWGRC